MKRSHPELREYWKSEFMIFNKRKGLTGHEVLWLNNE